MAACLFSSDRPWIPVLTVSRALTEIASWSPHHPIHVGAGWHSGEYGGNAVVRLCQIAGADVIMETNTNATPIWSINGKVIDPDGDFQAYEEGLAEAATVLGLPWQVMHEMLDLSDSFTQLVLNGMDLDFVTDHARGTVVVRDYVADKILPLLAARELRGSHPITRRPRPVLVAERCMLNRVPALATDTYGVYFFDQRDRLLDETYLPKPDASAIVAQYKERGAHRMIVIHGYANGTRLTEPPQQDLTFCRELVTKTRQDQIWLMDYMMVGKTFTMSCGLLGLI